MLLVCVVGPCCWSVLLVYVVGPCCWSVLLVHVVGLCCWSMLLVHVVGLCCWFMLLVHVVGPCCWSMLLVCVVGVVVLCRTFMRLIPIPKYSIHVGSTTCLYTLLTHTVTYCLSVLVVCSKFHI